MSAGITGWEYLASDWENLNDCGSKGWELVTVLNRGQEPIFYMRRPLWEGKSVDN